MISHDLQVKNTRRYILTNNKEAVIAKDTVWIRRFCKTAKSSSYASKIRSCNSVIKYTIYYDDYNYSPSEWLFGFEEEIRHQNTIPIPRRSL